MIGMKIGKWTENLGALATWGVTAAERDTGKARVRFSWHALPHSRGRVGNVGILC
jgi:hypothetical protein